LEGYKVLPRYLDIQGLGNLTPDILFENIYKCTVQEIKAKDWKTSEPGREYENFLSHLQTAKESLDRTYGPHWLVILLVDELDNAVSKLINDHFFQNLRNFLMVSSFNRNFRMVASGVREMANLISSGSSPLNNLRNKHLEILSGKQADRLVKTGFKKDLDTEAMTYLYKLTGKHPYLMQGVLEQLWEERGDLDSKAIKKAGKIFSKETQTFSRWMQSLGAAEREGYRALINAPEESLSLPGIHSKVPFELSSKVEEALTVLSYHLIIDDSDEDEIKIAGTMFKDWFKFNCPPEQNIKLSKEEPSSDKQSESPPQSPPNIHIEVNPIIYGSNTHIDNRQGMDTQEVITLFKELKAEANKLPLDFKIQKEIEDALNNGLAEISNSKNEKEPEKKTLENSLEDAAGILKKAGATADQLESFIEKAKKIGIILGKTAGWVATLFV